MLVVYKSNDSKVTLYRTYVFVHVDFYVRRVTSKCLLIVGLALCLVMVVGFGTSLGKSSGRRRGPHW